MSDEDQTQKTGLAATGDGAMTKTKTLAEQQAEIDAVRDKETAAREARESTMHSRTLKEGYDGRGDETPSSRTNPSALATRPDLEDRAGRARSAFLAKKAAPPEGEQRLRFHCISCGWNQTLSFDPADPEDAKTIESLGGDVANYSGPCPAEGCGYMTLIPHDGLGHLETFNEIAARQKADEAGIVADAVLDRIEERAGNVLFGSAAKAAAEQGEGHEDDAPDPSSTALPSGSGS